MDKSRVDLGSILRNLSWVTSASIVNQALNVLFLIFSSKILSPEEYGMLAIIMVIVGFSDILVAAGFVPALVQKSDVSEKQYSSVFYVTLVISTLVAISIALSDRLFEYFFEISFPAGLFYLVSISFLSIPFRIVPFAQSLKALNYKRISQVYFISNVVSLILAATFLFMGFGIWAMVGKFVLYNVISSTTFWFLVRWKPLRYFSFSEIRDLFKFGSNQSGADILGYWSRKIDDVLIGKFVGQASLGIYAFAYNFFVFPTQFVKSQVVSVAFPTLSALKDDRKEFKKMYLEISKLLAYVGLPVSLGLFSVCPEIIIGFIGPKWESAIPLIKLFCVATVFEISIIPGALFQAIGRPDLNFKITSIVKGFGIICIVVALPYGIYTVAQTLILSSIVNFFIQGYMVQKVTGITIWKVLLANLPAALLCILMLLCMQSISMINPGFFVDNIIILFVAKTITGISIWLAGVFILKPSPLAEIIKLSDS